MRVTCRDCLLQVVRLQAGSRLALLAGGEVVGKAEHLEVIDSLEQLLSVFCEDSMLERVQLQVKTSLMLIHEM